MKLSYNPNMNRLSEEPGDKPGGRYVLTESRCEAEDCEDAIVYGIALCGSVNHTVVIADLSSVRGHVEALIELCNRNQVPEEQLQEIIDDFLP